jgi:hypothetical protein
MSLQQVQAFYELLTLDQTVYEQYYNKCCCRGFFGIWNWDKTKIVNFAASMGYEFNETELDQLCDDTLVPETVKSSDYQTELHYEQQARYPTVISFS